MRSAYDTNYLIQFLHSCKGNRISSILQMSKLKNIDQSLPARLQTQILLQCTCSSNNKKQGYQKIVRKRKKRKKKRGGGGGDKHTFTDLTVYQALACMLCIEYLL